MKTYRSRLGEIEFISKYGSDLMEEIFNCFYDRKDSDRVTIHSIHKHDSINYEFMATIYDNEGNELCEASCRDGNWNGSEILDFGDIATPKRFVTRYFLGIRNDLVGNKNAETIFSYWKKEAWFKEMEQKINYDFHFEPTNKIRSYWKDRANSKGLEIISDTIEVDS